MSIKAIETLYAGCRFRSRLEARWAVFLDHLGVRWDYEAEGYDTPAGPYLPDFLLYLPEPTLFEVKPENADYDERWSYMPHRLVVACGMPRLDQLDPSRQPDWGQLNMYWPDGCDVFYAFCVCPWCGAVGIEFSGLGGRVCGHGAHPEGWVTYGGVTLYDENVAYTYAHPRLVAAYTAARSARFEHGQTPSGGER